jgi:RHS repeat-associated protein
MVEGNTGEHTQGPALLLKVMTGDSISIGVKSYYLSGGTAGTNSSSLNSVLNTLAGGLVALGGGGGHGTLPTLDNSSGSPVYNALNTYFYPAYDSTPGSRPKAYLNWMLLDNQFNYVSGNNQSGAIPVGSPNVLNTLATTIKLKHSGYLYIWVSNETQNWMVFFDNLSIEDFSGPILEETHYYPFGLTMAGISDRAIKTNYAENKYRYNKGSELQNKEFTDGSGLEVYTTNYRLFDPQLGTFHQIDPLAEISEDQSPYSYAQSDPVLYNDPLGLTISDSSHPTNLTPATVTAHKNQSSASSLPPLLPYRLPKVVTDNVGVGLSRPQINPTMRFIPAEVANQAYSQPAYAKGTTVTQYRTTVKQKFVRVFNPKNGNSAQGKWMMKESEIQGLSPEQIQERFALPGQNAPSEIVEVEVPAGTLMQVGYAGTNAWGTGGGVQFEVMEAIPSSSFGTPTALPVPDVPTGMPAVEFPEEPIIPEGEFIPGEFMP